ncbi:MAG: aspartyl protease family protein [Bacteroidota bacterium]
MRSLLYIFILLFPICIFSQENIALVGSKGKFEDTNGEVNRLDGYETSLELHDRIILINAEVDGVAGKFILDTGSPTLMLNQKDISGKLVVGGISKNCTAQTVKVKEFKWAGISTPSVEALAFDMSKLEKTIGTKIAGLVGQRIFRDYELYIDVANQKIQLHRSRKSQLHKNNKPKSKISFSLEKHIPVIKVKINGKKYRFGIDTGAEVNVLNQRIQKQLEEAGLLNLNQATTLQGVDGIAQKTQAVHLTNFKIKSKNFKDYEFLMMDFSSLEKDFDLQLDGILGYPFLATHILSINYSKQKIYFW